MSLAQVKLWGRSIGAVSWDDQAQLAYFEYEPDFIRSGIEVAPLTMPLSKRIYSFPQLDVDSFHGLPGLLADSLPDDFGNALINTWLLSQGRSADSLNPVERLCYTGKRGMGALEYLPVQGPQNQKMRAVDVNELVSLAGAVLQSRSDLKAFFSPEWIEGSLQNILRVGTSAGGARAKAIIAWNPESNEVVSGQIQAGDGFSYWLLKFDSVTGNGDKELHDPSGYGQIEYAYYLMALEAGITMSESRLLEENGRQHFMTKRFDRLESGKKLHMQSLGAMQHVSYKKPGIYSYEQALASILKLGLSMETVEEQFRRMAFNIIARNQDDHVKNIAFLMDQLGNWSLSPAYDITYSYNPQGIWTGRHQMALNGKRDLFTIDDFIACEKMVSMRRGRAKEIIKEVQSAILKWPKIAKQVQIPSARITAIANTHRREI